MYNLNALSKSNEHGSLYEGLARCLHVQRFFHSECENITNMKYTYYVYSKLIMFQFLHLNVFQNCTLIQAMVKCS